MKPFFSVISIFIVIFVGSIFWNHKQLKQNINLEKTPIFTIDELHGKAYIKKSRIEYWDLAGLKESLSSGDQIKTLEPGSLVLNFADGWGRLELGSETTLKLDKEGGNNKINFYGGELFIAYHSTSNKNSTTVNFNNIKVDITDSDVFFYKDEAGKNNISVSYGKALIYINENKMELESGQILTLSSPTQFLISQPSLKMSTPLNFDRYSMLNKNKITIRFAWTNQSSYNKYQLYAGESVGSLKALGTAQFLKKNEMQIDLSPGVYYFRLYGFESDISRNSVFSDLIKVFVSEQVEIQPIFPEQEAEYLLDQMQKAEVQFQWDNPSQFEKLFIEVSRTPNFKELTFHDTVHGANYLFVNFERPGEYYWRVNGFPRRSSKLILGKSRKLIIK